MVISKCLICGGGGQRSGCKAIQKTSPEGIERAALGRTIGWTPALRLQAVQELSCPRGSRVLACDANGSVTFQLAQMSVGPGTAPLSIVLYIDWTFIKRGIPILFTISYITGYL